MEHSSPLYAQYIGNVSGNSSEPLGIMLHGFGASAESIAHVAQEMRKVIADWIIPQGDSDLTPFLGTPGYAWFPHKEDEIRYALLGEDFWDTITHMDPDGLRSSAERIYEFLEQQSLLGRSFIVAGFSQGGMIASELALLLSRKQVTTRALVLFSSCLIATKRWNETARTIKPSLLPPVWQSHGEDDTILSLSNAVQLHEFWNTCSPSVEFHTFDGGHDIPADVLQQALTFISTHL